MNVLHLVSCKQFTDKEQVEQLMDHVPLRQDGKRLACLFFQPSLRTRFSFEAAALALGMGVLTHDDAMHNSAVVKGESLVDTLQTVAELAHVVVVRYPERFFYQNSLQKLKTVLLNGGDADNEHPTQALLDVYTMREKLGTVDGLKIACVGDLLHSRTLRSLVYLLRLYKVHFIFSSPADLALPNDLASLIKECGSSWSFLHTLERVLREKPDVLYMIRPQQDKRVYTVDHVLTPRLMELLPSESIVMHPLPRRTEIDPACDAWPNCVYFQQVAYGLQIRQALLSQILTGQAKWSQP